MPRKGKRPENWPKGADLQPLPRNKVKRIGNEYLVLKDFRETPIKIVKKLKLDLYIKNIKK